MHALCVVCLTDSVSIALTHSLTHSLTQQFEEFKFKSHDQHSDFTYTDGLKTLSDGKGVDAIESRYNPCRNRKQAKPGDALWCLCNGDETLVNWRKGDAKEQQPIVEKVKKLTAKANKNSKEKTELEENVKILEELSSDCSNFRSLRFKKCHWKGEAEGGKCCSIAKGCVKAKKEVKFK